MFSDGFQLLVIIARCPDEVMTLLVIWVEAVVEVGKLVSVIPREKLLKASSSPY